MIPRRSRGDALELLDQPGLDLETLRVSLRDVERLNRWFGGTHAVIAEVARVVAERGLAGKVKVLDVGAGGADIPRAMARWGRLHGLSFDIVGCDRHEQIVTVGARFSAGSSSVSLLQADALALPFVPGCFDFVTCSLMLHHLDEEHVVSLLGELRRLPRHALVACDLERSWRGYAGVWVATRLFCRARLTRHDGPLSVLRAYTLDELRMLSRQAGCDGMRWSRSPFYRLIGVLDR